MILQVSGVKKYFGGLCALAGLDLSIEERQILGLIGPNGSGKTTLFNTIAGVYKPNGGRIFFKGEEVTGQKPYTLASKGLARTFQVTKLFSHMTAMTNLLMGLHCRTRAGVWKALIKGKSVKAEEERSVEKAFDILKFMNLAHAADQPAELLSSAEQRRLMIGIALATQPSLLLLDEPTAGMSAEEAAEVVDLIGHLRDRGMSVLLIEHNMKVAMNICDRFIAIESGAKIAEGTPEEVVSNETVIEAYLGKD